MADANGIIFKNPTLNTWFVAPAVDLTAWNVLTVSNCPDTAFNLEYTYVPAAAKWSNGTRHIWKDTLWYLSDGTTTFHAPDNGLNTPPATFYRTLEYPLTIRVVGAGFSGVNGDYQYSFGGGEYPPMYTRGFYYLKYNYGDEQWNISSLIEGLSTSYYLCDSTDFLPPKSDWLESVPTGDLLPAPTLEYSLEAGAASVSPTSSTATWVSNNPTSGFVSLTGTPNEDFGYVITFDVQGGADYPYYKYCTKTAGEVYGALPETTRDGFIFAGWFTLAGGEGTRIAATDELLEAADATFYAKWVNNVSGKIGCGACLVSLFVIGIGTDIFCESIGSRLSKTTPQTIVRRLPTP
jgi:uncharacterized repeat protein (TIGR02543 family)